MNRFQAGDRVILKADPEVGAPEERATVRSYSPRSRMYIVELDPEYWQTEFGDDGLREVGEGVLEPGVLQ